VLSTFTISSIAPTLFGRKTENCLTSGPPIFEVVSGKSTGISMAVAQASACGTKISQPGRLCHEALSHCRSSHCNSILVVTRPLASALTCRSLRLKPLPVLHRGCSFLYGIGMLPVRLKFFDSLEGYATDGRRE